MADTYTLRRLSPGDAPGVSACLRTVYGDGYLRSELYRPDDIVRRNEAGDWVSAVALDAGGLVVGHLALEISRLDPVAELSMGFVLPEHRRRRVLEDLRDLLLGEAARLGLCGQLVEMGTVDTAAQSVADRSPARPCALTLGLWPDPARPAPPADTPSADTPSAGAPPADTPSAAAPPSHTPSAAAPPARRNFIRYFRFLQRPSGLVLHAPPRHEGMLARIYGQLGVPVELWPEQPAAGPGQILVFRNEDLQYAALLVRSVGEDTGGQLAAALAGFHEDARMEAAYLELPLGAPGAAAACDLAERHGFFFSGVAPCAAGAAGSLRLQCLKGEPSLETVQVTHPFARELVAYVGAERERVARGARR